MRTEKVRDILHSTKNFHRLISNYYEEMSTRAPKERIKFLLDYLSHHERHLEDTFREYEENASHKILDSWIRFSSCDDKLKQLKEILENNSTEIEDIIEVAVELDDAIIDMYRELIENSETDELKNLFKDLMDIEEHQERQTMRDMAMLKQI